MPRKDRSFTASDIIRLHCRHLSQEERAIVEAVGLVCDDDITDDALIIAVLEMLLHSPFVEIIGLMPASDYIIGAIEFSIILLKAKAEVGELDRELFTGNSVLFLDLDPDLPST